MEPRHDSKSRSWREIAAEAFNQEDPEQAVALTEELIQALDVEIAERQAEDDRAQKGAP